MRIPWLESRDESRLARAALFPLAPAEWLYGLGARVHRGLHEAGRRPRRRLDCRVVSVGNLTVGGSGKTPLAAWLASRLHARGFRTVIATRGYARRRQDAVTVISDGRHVLADPASAGDEPLLLAAHAPGVPVLAGADRGVVGLRAVGLFGAEVLVLDDGFQHHRLDRDAEIVLVDGAFGFGNRHVLPRGPLREKPAALSRAHAIGVVDGPLSESDAEWLARWAPGALRFAAHRRPRHLRPLAGRVPGRPGGGLQPPASLSGLEVGLLAGIARPESLQRTLEGLGAKVVARRTFRDHHRYRPRDVRGLGRSAPLWITTEKDAVKILPHWVRGAEVLVLTMAVDVETPDVLLDWLTKRLQVPASGSAPIRQSV